MKQALTAPVAFTTLSLVMTMRRNIGMIRFSPGASSMGGSR